MDRHTEDQSETMIPDSYPVAGYKGIRKSAKCIQSFYAYLVMTGEVQQYWIQSFSPSAPGY